MASRRNSEFYLNNPKLPTKQAEFEYTAEMLDDIKKSKKNILHFAENFFFIIDPDEGRQKIKMFKYQKRCLKTLRDNRRVLLLASRQIGKALDVNTPIPVPGGWSTMGKLRDGDKIYGLDGNPYNVIKAHDVMYNRNCYEIEFDNGEKIVADEDHNWFTQSKYEAYQSINGSVKTTKEIYETLHVNNIENHRIPACVNGIEGVLQNQENIPHPYIFIKTIIPVDSRPVRCITVDSPDNLFLCGNTYIPTHNTTILTIYALWEACFNDDKNIVIVANKEDTAKEIFRRVKLAYEELPSWIKPGIEEWGQTSCKFSNGTRIWISTTTGSSARGTSINCVTGDNIITLRDKNTGIIFNSSLSHLHKLLEHNRILNTYIKDNIDLQEHTTLENVNFDILTADGYKNFRGLIVGNNKNKIKISFQDSPPLDCTHKHKIMQTENDYIHAENVKVGDVISSKTVTDVCTYSSDDEVYDLLEVEGTHTYFVNDILCHQCLILDELAFIEPPAMLEAFWRSVYPTISRSKTSKVLIASTPNGVGNLFHKLVTEAEEGTNGFVVEKVMWDEMPREPGFREQEIASLGIDGFLQEYCCCAGNTEVGVNILDETETIDLKRLYTLV